MKGKRKTVIALLAALCMSTAVAGFAACGKSGHTHVDANYDGVCDECNEPLRYVVTFDTNGGSALPRQAVAIGGKAEKPSNPVRDGFVFEGWFKADGTAFDFDAEVTENTTVYAHWTDAAATADTYFAYEDVDGGVEISAKPGETLPQDVILPAAHGGKAVVAIAEDGFAYQPALRGIKIPASVKKIGARAFRGSNTLATVNGGENVEEVGYGAFNGTAWDAGLTVGEVYIGKTLYRYAGSMFVDTQITAREGTVGIAAGAFQGLTRLVGITLPDTVTNIGSYAFTGTGLLTVTVNAATPVALGTNALQGFTGKVFVPKASIEAYKAADGWKAHKENIYALGTADQTFIVTFSAEGATDVPEAQNVKGFQKATAPTKNPQKTDYEFGGWYKDAACTVPFDFESEEITENTTVYAKFAKFFDVTFSAQEGTENVQGLPAKQHIEAGKTATKPTEKPTLADNEFMGWYADEQCTREFDFSAPVTGATTVYAKFLPVGADYTGEGEYAGWEIVKGKVKKYTGSLTEIKIPKELTRLDSIAEIMGTPSLDTIAPTSNLKNITSITVDDENEYFKVENGALMSKDGSVLYLMFQVSGCTYKWPTVIKIAPYAFVGHPITASNIASTLQFNENLVSIGDYAFYASNGLTDFTKFKSAETIGTWAFFGAQFTKVESDAKTIKSYAFIGSNNPQYAGKSIKEIILPNIVTLGDNVFGYEKATSFMTRGPFSKIVIGPNAKNFGEGAFGYDPNQGTSCRVILLGDELQIIKASVLHWTDSVNAPGIHMYVYVKEALYSKFLKEASYSTAHHGFYTEDGWFVQEEGTLAAYEGDMTNVTMPKEITSLSGILDIFGTTANLDKCTKFTAEGNDAFKFENGALLSADGKTLYGYFGDGTGNFSEVTEIKPYAFYNRLKAGASVTFGTIKTVGEYAFYGCEGLTNFKPFENLPALAAHAFEKSGLTSVTLSNPAITTIPDAAFKDCANLTAVYLRFLNPPTFSGSPFAVGETTKLYVPEELVDDCKAKWTAYEAQITADPEVHVYTVTFDTNTAGGGTAVESQKYLTGGKAVKPETDPTRKDYFFDGWYTKGEAEGWGDAFNFESAINANTTVYAKWTKGVTVTYDTGDSGAEVASELVRPGKQATQPEVPKWKGHVFLGWYKDKDCTEGQEFDFAKDTVSGDITLHAKWESGKVVTFNTGNGGSAVEEQAVLPGEKVTRPETDPTRQGYKFVDWYTKDGTEGDWGDKFDFDTYKMGNEDLTIYAKWDEDFWKVDENGKLTNYYGPAETVELPAMVKSITSILDIFGTKTNFAKCTSFTLEGTNEGLKMVDGALLSADGATLYAYFGGGATFTWENVTAIGPCAFYHFLTEDKTLTFSAELKSVGANAFESVPITSFEPFENVETIGADAFKGTKLVNIVWNTSGEVSKAFNNITTLKTVRLMNCKTIAANAFDGCSAITAVYMGERLTSIGQHAFWSAGNGKHKWDVWCYALAVPTCGGKTSLNSSQHPLGGDTNNAKGNITIHVPNSAMSTYKSTVNWNWYTNYKAIEFTLNLHMGEGDGVPAAPTVKTKYWGSALTKPVPENWKGKVFEGWFTKDGSTTQDWGEEFDFAQAIKVDTLDLYAKWSDGLYVEFHTGEGGPEVAWQPVRPGEKTAAPAEPQYKGHDFLGWFTKDGTTSGDWGTEFNFEDTAINQNTDLYAKWKDGIYVEYHLNGGTKPTTGTWKDWFNVESGTKIEQPSNPTRRNWNFEGWFTKDGTEDGDWGTKFDFEENGTITQNTDLYAKWNPWTINTDGSVKTYAGDKFKFEIPLELTKLNSIADIFKGTSTSTSSFSTSSMPKFNEGTFEITVAANHEYFKVENKALMSKDGKTIYFYFGMDEGTTFSSTDATKVADYAFCYTYVEKSSYAADEKYLTTVNLPSVTSIGVGGFYRRKAITSLSLGTIETLGKEAFSGAAVPDYTPFKNTPVIDEYAFASVQFANGTLEINNATIKSMAFSGCALKWLTLGEGVKSIENNGIPDSAFTTRAVIKALGETPATLGGSFSLGRETTQSTSKATNATVIVPDGKLETYQTADRWKNHTGFKFIEQKDVNKQGNDWLVAKGKVYTYFGSLETVVLPKEVTEIESIVDIFGVITNVDQCTSFTVEAETHFKKDGDMLITADGNKVVYYFGKEATVDVKTATEIGNYAFYKKTALTTITGSNIQKIGKYAFRECALLASIDLTHLTEVLDYAFYNCTALNSVSLATVQTVAYAAFSGSGLTSVSLDAVTSIGEFGFNNCKSLTSVTIGANCTEIGANAFSSCASLVGEGGSITIKAAVPPTLGAEGFGNATNLKTNIKVPTASLTDYQQAAVWKNYAAHIVADDAE